MVDLRLVEKFVGDRLDDFGDDIADDQHYHERNYLGKIREYAVGGALKRIADVERFIVGDHENTLSSRAHSTADATGFVRQLVREPRATAGRANSSDE